METVAADYAYEKKNGVVWIVVYHMLRPWPYPGVDIEKSVDAALAAG